MGIKYYPHSKKRSPKHNSTEIIIENGKYQGSKVFTTTCLYCFSCLHIILTVHSLIVFFTKLKCCKFFNFLDSSLPLTTMVTSLNVLWFLCLSVLFSPKLFQDLLNLKVAYVTSLKSYTGDISSNLISYLNSALKGLCTRLVTNIDCLYVAISISPR